MPSTRKSRNQRSLDTFRVKIRLNVSCTFSIRKAADELSVNNGVLHMCSMLSCPCQCTSTAVEIGRIRGIHSISSTLKACNSENWKRSEQKLNHVGPSPLFSLVPAEARELCYKNTAEVKRTWEEPLYFTIHWFKSAANPCLSKRQESKPKISIDWKGVTLQGSWYTFTLQLGKHLEM